MLDRCYNEGNEHYQRYGGRGITVCPEWKESFAAFYQDMWARPSKEHSLDRINNDYGYSKANCRWATWEEQAANRSNNFYCEYQGQKRLLKDICAEVGVEYYRTYIRLQSGWSLEEALAKKVRKYNKRKSD